MPRPVRILLLILLVALAITVLFTTVFPRVERILEQDPTLGAPASVAVHRDEVPAPGPGHAPT